MDERFAWGNAVPLSGRRPCECVPLTGVVFSVFNLIAKTNFKENWVERNILGLKISVSNTIPWGQFIQLGENGLGVWWLAGPREGKGCRISHASLYPLACFWRPLSGSYLNSKQGTHEDWKKKPTILLWKKKTTCPSLSTRGPSFLAFTLESFPTSLKWDTCFLWLLGAHGLVDLCVCRTGIFFSLSLYFHSQGKCPVFQLGAVKHCPNNPHLPTLCL